METRRHWFVRAEYGSVAGAKGRHVTARRSFIRACEIGVFQSLREGESVAFIAASGKAAPKVDRMQTGEGERGRQAGFVPVLLSTRRKELVIV
jgi:hypothetical protein